MRRFLVFAGLTIGILAVAYVASVALEIQRQSTRDESRPADVIVVLGAAEYRGRPSPVLRARLDHGLYLFQQGFAPRILTTGGAGGDPEFTEGEVGRAYLVRRGVPSEAIIVEPEGSSTAQSIAAVAEIMIRMNLHSCIVVSDGYHIFRVKRMLQWRGVVVYGSPRPTVPRYELRDWWLYLRQAVGYGLWRLNINI
ncbi:MAG: YdcF family protein [Acidobacteria bacterium]|nr:YdcF family protein [Acidobacteriota bacterium]